MATKAPTPLLLDTYILSKIITDVLDEVGVAATRKSACLNRAAALIAGPKHNWGYLTGLDLPFAAQTLSSAYRITPAADAPDHLTEPAGGILTAPPRHEAFGDLHEDLRREDEADDADDRPILSQMQSGETVTSAINTILADAYEPLGSLEGTARINAILREEQPSHPAILRAVAIAYREKPAAGVFASSGSGTVMDLLDYLLRADVEASVGVMAYIIENPVAVQADIGNQAVLPVTWIAVAELVWMVEEARTNPRSTLAPKLSDIARHYIDERLGSHADALRTCVAL